MDRNTAAIYLAGLLQGIALVAFPAVSTILTNPQFFHLSNTQYGSLFIPQALLSIATAALNPLFCRRFGCRGVFTAGLTATFLSMTLLALSAAFMHNHSLAYWMLMIATGCLGIGFGVVVPTINRVAEELYPTKSDAAVLTLNALLGVGTALSPVFIIVFTAIGFWWGLPVLLAIALLFLVLFSFSLKFPQEKEALTAEETNQKGIKGLLLVFIVFAFLYGIVETLNANWVAIYMSKYLNAPIHMQSLALASFWGMVTFGRFFFAKVSQYLKEETAFQIAPFIVMAAFTSISSLTSGQERWAIAAFGLAGLGCAVLLPLTISFGGKQLKGYAAAVPGMIISAYLLGYGVAAFGAGPLQEFAEVSLRSVYAIGSGVAFVLGLIAVYIARRGRNTIETQRID